MPHTISVQQEIGSVEGDAVGAVIGKAASPSDATVSTVQTINKIEPGGVAVGAIVVNIGAQEQELAKVCAALDELQNTVRMLTAGSADRQAWTETVARLEALQQQAQAYVGALQQAQKPAEAARWQAALKRIGELILLLVGVTLLDELFPDLKTRLHELLGQARGIMGPQSSAAPSAPAPAPTRAPTPSRPAEPKVRGPLDFDWVTIPAGEFLMGSDRRKDASASDNELPQHRVYLPAYRIARTPVTVAQFVAFVRAADYRTTAERQKSDYCWYQPHGRGSAIGRDKLRHPVTQVSWEDALAFCRWAGVRLPTEPEWEKAARGADGRIWPWGNELPDRSRCNFGNNVGDTTPVGQYSPRGDSHYGCADMIGNVWEWTSSWHAKYPYNSKDGREALDGGRGTYRVVRGGSWYGDLRYARCAYRGRLVSGISTIRSSVFGWSCPYRPEFCCSEFCGC
ncbi:MAG: SUMF1/EgtB/PvdO family nonheme iron enzyme [Chloroflexi bacterium]|nr:SUMF1/EgtB/PvdO family nonheme iron enzyme [Chloroflexota bacterium]